ncbi:MAG: MerR family transcriptional regulator [Burkholderiales bacterium]|nr:MerR family transcriptional regulator [Burkholderiales bacterium]MBH1997083.1 MerR family transcriptional regulator [Burkholderiales bacterium]MBH2068685.1 MerR family transcriptional regulator [Burkholderiales bacterium]
MVQSLLPPQSDNSQPVQYRSGVAARLAGLPVETLRVWERRYGISDTGRSAHGQRLYSEDQVRRLRLMKQLVDQGHPIGALAKLQLEQLGQFALVPEPGEPLQPMRLALMGTALARRLAVGGRELLALDIVAHFQNLDEVAATWPGTGAQLLLMEISELDERVVPAIGALRQELGMAVVVLYRFGASATIRQLRAQGCLVARVPNDVAEIVLLCQAALAALPLAQAQLARQRPAAPAPRRFDDRALAELAAASSTVHCECPRHLTEILLMINSFERYSEQCSSRNVADALLHEQLGHAAATARMVLEEALLRLARAEALPLPVGM